MDSIFDHGDGLFRKISLTRFPDYSVDRQEEGFELSAPLTHQSSELGTWQLVTPNDQIFRKAFMTYEKTAILSQ